MLTDIGSGDDELSKRDRVIGEEVELQELLGIGVVVDDAGDVDNEPNGLVTNTVSKGTADSQ